MKIISKFAKIYIFLDLVVILFCILANNYLWLLNSQIAFISSMVIIIGSFYGYKKNILSRAQDIQQNSNFQEDEPRDVIDEMDDPYDLYGEINEQEEFSKDEIKEIIKDEKKKIGKNSLKNTIFSATGFFSPYRVVGYIVLIAGFFALNNNNLFHIYSYFIGLFVVSLATLLLNFRVKSSVNL